MIWSEMTDGQKKTVRMRIKTANDRGLEVRYWETPSWPMGRRNKVWKFLVDEGVGLLNVDDLHDAAFGDWD